MVSTHRARVTNAEVHGIIRRHVSRFVPSLKIPPSRESSEEADSGAPAVAKNHGAEAMVVDDPETQEPGISSTRYVTLNYMRCELTNIAAYVTQHSSASLSISRLCNDL